jgi:hypothetical protein
VSAALTTKDLLEFNTETSDPTNPVNPIVVAQNWLKKAALF